MLKVLLPVDGSEASVRAPGELIAMLAWFKERPAIELLAVHLPVPRLPNMKLVVSDEAIERYYAEETGAMVAASRKALDAAGIQYTVHKLVGPVAESIVDHARAKRCDMIYIGTRGMTGAAAALLGSTATKVLHLSSTPVLLVK